MNGIHGVICDLFNFFTLNGLSLKSKIFFVSCLYATESSNYGESIRGGFKESYPVIYVVFLCDKSFEKIIE